MHPLPEKKTKTKKSKEINKERKINTIWSEYVSVVLSDLREVHGDRTLKSLAP